MEWDASGAFWGGTEEDANYGMSSLQSLVLEFVVGIITSACSPWQ